MVFMILKTIVFKNESKHFSFLHFGTFLSIFYLVSLIKGHKKHFCQLKVQLYKTNVPNNSL